MILIFMIFMIEIKLIVGDYWSGTVAGNHHTNFIVTLTISIKQIDKIVPSVNIY